MIGEHGSTIESLAHSADEFQIQLARLQDSQKVTQSAIAEIREILRGNDSLVKKTRYSEGNAKEITEHRQAIVGIEGHPDISRGLTQVMAMKSEIRELQESLASNQRKGRMTRLSQEAVLILGILNVVLLLLPKTR